MLTLGLLALWFIPSVFWVLVFYQFWYERQFSKKAGSYSGRIVRHAVSHSPNRMFSPVIEWIGPDESSRQFRDGGWSSFRRRTEGDSVNVLFGLDMRGKSGVCIDSHLSRYPYLELISALLATALVLKVSCVAKLFC